MLNDFIDYEDFWSDGNYGKKRISERNKAEAAAVPETFKEKQAREEKERNKLAAALWKAETDGLRIHKSYYTGDMDAFHEGECCAGCMNDMADGYSGGGSYCCCYEGKTPLEQWGNPVKYPPVDGKVPEVFHKWGPRTQERYLKRFEGELHDYCQVHERGVSWGTVHLD